MQHRCDGGQATGAAGIVLLSGRFQMPFYSTTTLAERTPNTNGADAVTRRRDISPSKKSLPALVAPSTLPNKVAIQRQLSRDHR